MGCPEYGGLRKGVSRCCCSSEEGAASVLLTAVDAGLSTPPAFELLTPPKDSRVVEELWLVDTAGRWHRPRVRE